MSIKGEGSKEIQILAPLTGQVVPLEQVPDPVFSQKIVGDGVAAGIVALGGVVLQQVSQHLGRGQVVDSDDFEALSAEHLTESQTADTAKTVNSNFNRHVDFLQILFKF